MSLLEDLVDLLRYVLEYFGVPTDMLVPVWETTLCGQYRSIVRMIGTNLPLAPHPRVHFQIPLQTFRRHGHIDVSVDAPGIPSLADVLYLAEDEGDSCTKFRSTIPLRKCEWPQKAERPASAAPSAQNGHRALGQSTQPEALQKISALEAELMKLRAQIALIVATPTADSPLLSAPATPCSAPLPAPVLTSTPLCAPPPPPPPPPPPAVANLSQVSVTQVIRQRQAARKDKAEPSECTSAAALPSMLDVLKDMNQVKLRTVERSPGGTPVRKRRSKGAVCMSDPAALIAEALKRKFAHKQKDDSFDKENRSAELSPFSSPDTPRISHPLRRGQGRIHL
ncbi:mitochondrial fission regulator 2 isoform X2 [Colossoma macropomum]|uniref:mitochondrial fission regulator 2 isoform X2 n=1 Tax=Colossoma macropomum TaxID=42526 RepID=UPI001863F069|nr:mitochondrial fission regulator 2 isoform X2 [Colossoma macropomum]